MDVLLIWTLNSRRRSLPTLRAADASSRPEPRPSLAPPSERITLAPDLELHVRRPHAEATRRMVDEIRSLVDRRLG